MRLKFVVFCMLSMALPTQVRAGDYAWWPLNDGQGDMAQNLVAGGTAGQIFGANSAGLGQDASVWVNDPERGTVLGLDGTNGWVDAGVLPMMTFDNQFSWSFWSKQHRSQVTNNDIIVGNRYAPGGGDTSPREFIKFTPTQFEFHTNGAATGNIPYEPFVGSGVADPDVVNIPSDDQWYHHAVVKQGDTITYYRDGVAQNSTTFSVPMGSADPLPFALGGQNGAETWRGYLSDVQLYESALDSAGIASTMNGELATGDLYARWLLNEGDGETAADSGPNGFDGDIFDWDFDGLADDGSVWVDDPDRGTVLGLGGNTAWVEAGELPLMDTENNFTWAFWARQDPEQASPANDIIIGNRYGFDGADTSPREFIKFTPDRFEYHMETAGVGDTQYGTAPDGPWVHHIVVKDGDTFTYYRDGEYAGESIMAEEQLSPDPLPFVMGGQEGAEHWAGYLSEVRLFDHALVDSEIAELSGGVELLEGDFDRSGVLDLADVNLLIGGILAGSGDFDLNSDGNIDDADLNVWVKDLRQTWVGDANLDGEFNSSDFVQVFTFGEYEDTIVGNSTWDEGDWNGDGEFSSSDFVAAFTDGGYEQGFRNGVAAVPEPQTFVLILTSLLPLFRVIRRR